MRKVVADFSGGHLSSDGGALLLRTVDRGLGISRALARCFSDRRDQRFVEFSVQELLAQRLYGLALGYEDLNDHTALRRDPLLAVAVDRADPLGAERVRAQQGNGLASASTLNRLELGAQEEEGRYRKINVAPEQVEAALLEMGVRSLPRATRLVVLDFDATDDPLHGSQEGRFFHGYYGHYCYLPLFCFAGTAVLWAQLRTSDRDGSDGTLEALEKIVAALRRRFGRKLRIVVRGDSGFAREAIMAWCEEQRQAVFYCLGLARNGRLEEALEQAFMRARERHTLCGGASVREFADLRWRTIESWSRERRVIGKAEVTAQGDNPRLIVTNLPVKAWADLRACEGSGRFADAAAIYERLYCERGNAENQIKQMTLDLHADRLSTHWLASNQMRLWLSSFAPSAGSGPSATCCWSGPFGCAQGARCAGWGCRGRSRRGPRWQRAPEAAQDRSLGGSERAANQREAGQRARVARRVCHGGGRDAAGVARECPNCGALRSAHARKHPPREGERSCAAKKSRERRSA